MKVVTVVGARPQFIKEAAISRVLKNKHEEILVHTGQHFDKNMSEIFFEELEIRKPDYDLAIKASKHGEMTGKMLEEIEKVLLKETPDMVVVFGDTNSTAAGALAAAKLHIPIAHIEAGGRIGTLNNPEEINRIVTDHISQILFAPTNLELDNLKKENLGDRAFCVGNIMYDSFLYYRDKNIVSQILSLQGEKIQIPEHYYYLTCHRQENTYSDEPLLEIFKAMDSLEYPTIYPVHPRNRERAERLCKKYKFSNIILIEPVGYIESIKLLLNATKVVTDSGGLQCEAFFAEKQCVTIFDYAVWPQTLVENRNQLCRTEMSEILEKLNKDQIVNREYQPFGDGRTAEKIVEKMEQYLNDSIVR